MPVAMTLTSLASLFLLNYPRISATNQINHLYPSFFTFLLYKISHFTFTLLCMLTNGVYIFELAHIPRLMMKIKGVIYDHNFIIILGLWDVEWTMLLLIYLIPVDQHLIKWMHIIA